MPKRKQNNSLVSALLAGTLLGILATLFFQQKNHQKSKKEIRRKLALLLNSDFDLSTLFASPKPLSSSKKKPPPPRSFK